jgi:predicted RNA-binding protein YlqC (UPF0109 family)
MLARNISYYIYRNGVWVELHSHNVVEGSVIPREGEIITGFGTSDAEYKVTKVRYDVFRSEVEIELAFTIA